MAFTEDLTAFFDENDFAVAATYNGTTAVSVILDREYMQPGGHIAGANPVAWGKASDFTGTAVAGKTLAANGTTWTIRNKEPQDDGSIVLLELEE